MHMTFIAEFSMENTKLGMNLLRYNSQFPVWKLCHNMELQTDKTNYKCFAG